MQDSHQPGTYLGIDCWVELFRLRCWQLSDCEWSGKERFRDCQNKGQMQQEPAEGFWGPKPLPYLADHSRHLFPFLVDKGNMGLEWRI